MKAVFRWCWRIILSLFLVLALFLTTVIVFKIPINLTRFKDPVEVLASELLDRKVTVKGEIVISTSLSPVFSLQGLTIGNPEGFNQKSFLDLDKVVIQLDLLPLLRMKAHIPEISVQGLLVTLEQNQGGEVNWTLGPGNSDERKKEAESAEEKKAEGAEKKNRVEVAGDSLVIERLALDKIELMYYRPNISEPATFQIEECRGTMPAGKPLELGLRGNLLSSPFKVSVSVASLEEFLTRSTSWMDIQAELEETFLKFSGNVKLSGEDRFLGLKTEVHGEQLRSLSGLLNVDLPPFRTYRLVTDLEVRPDHFILNNLKISTGTSSLVGTADVVREKGLVTADLKLHSPLIQLDDFLFEDWSWTGEEKKDAEPGESEEEKVEEAEAQKREDLEVAAADKEVRKVLDPDVLDDFDINLHIQADQVMSGEDQLGNGALEASLVDGRISVDPLELSVPGGSITMSASLKPGMESSDAALTAKMQNFDIGILVRRSKPEAKMSGLVNLDIDLRSSAAAPQDILANGNGYFDFSGQLENLGAGIIDLWAVNLIASIVSSTDEQESQINCAVGRWSVVDGILTPDVFVIDTSKIRICGSGRVDFHEQQVDLTVAPTAKKPEFFNLATPLKVKGSFDEINFGVKSGAIVGTALRFITSPVHVPIRRMVLEETPEDGSDVCSMPLGPDNRKPESIQGCRY